MVAGGLPSVDGGQRRRNVNVGSAAGLRPAANIGIYGTSKAAALYEGQEQHVAAGYPLQRLGMPDDVAGAVSFLLSDDAAWATGLVLAVDGGLMLTGGV
jgi:enoyl-[acyl-carrier-protein] reductase (NADH)